MICAALNTGERYNYSFVENGEVLLENAEQKFTVLYENWVEDFLIIDKWSKLNF